MLMSVDELYKLQQEKNSSLVVFDCRFKLSDPHFGEQQYQDGHIEGAAYLNLEGDLSSPVMEHGGRHPLPDIEILAKKLGDFGVSEQSTVVVYDSGEGMATRAWWLIRFLGHVHVFVLNGGLNAWMKANHPLVTKTPVKSPVRFVHHVQNDWIVDHEQVEKVSRKEQAGLLVDARAPMRYRGEIEPIDKAAGHIPNAVNAPWQDGIDEWGCWKSREQQHLRFAKFPLEQKPIIVYCGSGVTACATLFAMELAGLTGVKLYPGSWSDWVSYEDSSIETGNSKECQDC